MTVTVNIQGRIIFNQDMDKNQIIWLKDLLQDINKEIK